MIQKEEIFFPFQEVRPTQDAFIRAVIAAIENKKDLLGHVPTGTGKTIAALSPALKYALKNNSTIFFLTPRHTQHRLVIETLKLIKEKYPIKFSVIDFIGKKWMCAIKGTDLLSPSEFIEYCKEVREKGICEYYINYKNKTLIIPREILIKQLKETPAHVEELCKSSEEAKFCPYEIAGEVGKKSTILIGDYFHLLSSTIRDSIFKRTELSLENSIIIIDEAQNLPNRCRDLLSNQLNTFTIDNALKELSQFNLEYDVSPLKNILQNLSKKISIDQHEVLIKKEDLIQEIEKISSYNKIIEDFEERAKLIREVKKKSYLFRTSEFLKAWPGQDKGFVRILKRSFNKQGKPYLTIIYRCLDPTVVIQDLITRARSVICMSGTLYPLEMYRDLLGFTDPIMVSYESPFPKENQLNLIVPETTTKYTKRNREMYLEIANKCNIMIESGRGNFALFFPSYGILENIFLHLKEITKKKIFLEQQGMSKIEKEELISNFKDESKNGSILMGVSAGNFGEGIDLPGDLLQGVIIVGLPLAKPDLETKELVEYYEGKFGNGIDYGYNFPAITKCLQNAGRCIRSETDKGVIVFLDERYSWRTYRKYFPENMHFITTKSPEIKIKEFFEKNH